MGNFFNLLSILVFVFLPQISHQVELKVLLEAEVNAGPYKKVTEVLKIMGPGDMGLPAHDMPGITLGHVLEGEYLLQSGDGPFTILGAGQTFIVPAKQTHMWGANASKKTKCQVVFTIYSQVGDALVTPVDKKRADYDTAIKKATRKAAAV